MNRWPYTHVVSNAHPPGTIIPVTTGPSQIYIAPPGGVTLTEMVSYDVANAEIYAVFQGNNGAFYHYYNGIQVTDANIQGGYSFVRFYKTKMYAVGGRYLRFSAVGNPTLWQDPPPDGEGNVAHNGSGFIDIGSNDADADNLISMEVFYDKMALFSNLSCQLWFLDPDPSLNQYFQTLRDAGCLAARRPDVVGQRCLLSRVAWHSLAASARLVAHRRRGRRGLAARPRDPDDVRAGRPELHGARASGAGNAHRALLDDLHQRDFRAQRLPEPEHLGLVEYVPGFQTRWACNIQSWVVLADTTGQTYLFGGTGNATYDPATQLRLVFPFLPFDKPATFKEYQGFDMIATGTWTVEACFRRDADDRACLGHDRRGQRPDDDGRAHSDLGQGTHVQLRLTHQGEANIATFDKLFIHYKELTSD